MKKKTPAKLKKILWQLCKEITRARYKNKDGSWDCYTCDLRIDNPKDAHTAHFIASSISGAWLRYDLRNLRVCCGVCNVWRSGNFPAYYERMCKEIGRKETDALMAERHKIVKADVLFFEKKIAEYTALLDSV